MSLSIVTKPRKIDFTKNTLFFRLVASADSNYNDYHVRAQVSVENLSSKGTYSQLPEFRLDPDESGIVKLFDIGDIIRRKFSGYFDLPDWNMSAPVKTLATLIRCNVVFREMDGTEEINKLNPHSFKAINGRVNHADHPTFDILQFLSYNKKFLTNSPERIYTHHGSKHYLYYLNAATDSTKVRFKMEVETKSGNHNYTSSEITLDSHDGCFLPAGDIINSDYGNDVLFAKVWMEKRDGTTIAGPKYFHYSPKRLYAKTFLFQNRFGVFDTLNTQIEENSINVDRNNSRKNLSPGYKRLDGNLSSEIENVQDTFEAETGPIPIATAQHYKEMMESEAVFLQTSDRWVKVRINAGSFSVSDEGEDLQNISFEYRAAFSGDILNTEIDLPKAKPEDYSSEYLKTDYR